VVGALLIFVLVYALIAGRRLGFLRVSRAAAAIAGAAAGVLFGLLTPAQAYTSIDGDTLVLLIAMMVLAAHLHEAGFFEWGASRALRLTHTPQGLLTLVVFSVGLLSAFLTNDAVCFLLAPILVRVIRRAQLGSTLFLVALATSANIGSVMTIVGNPQTMIIGSLSNLEFRSYFLTMAPLGLVCLGLNRLLLPRFYPLRRRTQSGWTRQADWLDAPFDDADELPSDFRRTLAAELRPAPLVQCSIALAFALLGFFAGLNVAWSALAAAALLLLLAGREPRSLFRQVDWQLLLFVAGLFVVVGALRSRNASAAMFDVLRPWFGESPTRQGWSLALLTTVACNIVGNIPWVLVASDWMGHWGQARTGWMLLAMAGTFAGNLMLTSSMVNVLVHDASRDLEKIRFLDHLRYGAVITLLTTLLGTLWLLVVT
jgi:Na+/H+ antiporter NhaD/arsenite permease-like protein